MCVSVCVNRHICFHFGLGGLVQSEGCSLSQQSLRKQRQKPVEGAGRGRKQPPRVGLRPGFLSTSPLGLHQVRGSQGPLLLPMALEAARACSSDPWVLALTEPSVSLPLHPGSPNPFICVPRNALTLPGPAPAGFTPPRSCPASLCSAFGASGFAADLAMCLG